MQAQETELAKRLFGAFFIINNGMHLPIQYKPDTSKVTPEKFIFISENYISLELCNDARSYIDNNSSTHRRGSKTPEICSASFSTCLMPEPNKPIYHAIDLLLRDYNSRHNFHLIYMEPLELKRYDVGDEFTSHTDNYMATEFGLDRKLNIIVQLSDTQEYDGGDLCIGLPPFLNIPRSIGTVTIFPSNYFHNVSKITSGSRYSLIGHVWGPEFK